MPPKKPMNVRSQNRSELVDKVKEIKMRQKNWLKEREEHNSSTSRQIKPVDIESKNSKSQNSNWDKTPKLQELSQTAMQHGVKSVENDERKTMHENHGKNKKFNAWMKARKTPSETLPDARGLNDNSKLKNQELGASYVISKETNILPEKAKLVQSDILHGFPTDRTAKHIEASQSSSLTGNFRADEFDMLAEQIVNRVRDELDFKNKPYYSNHYTNSYDNNQHHLSKTNINSSSHSVPKCTSEDNTYKLGSCVVDNGAENSFISSDSRVDHTYLEGHYCPQCAQLMIGKHDPMLIIPCGHNICKSCSTLDDVDLCSVCSCEVSSFTSNIMLKQIIVDHKRDKRRTQSGHNKRVGSWNETPVLEKDYKEEIKSLMIRLDVLESESDNIKDVMDSIKREIKSEQHQISNIEGQEQRIKEQIEDLNEKLDALSNHKQDYFDKCEKLEEKQKLQENKLTMVKETIRQLNREVENIQLNEVAK